MYWDNREDVLRARPTIWRPCLVKMWIHVKEKSLTEGAPSSSQQLPRKMFPGSSHRSRYRCPRGPRLHLELTAKLRNVIHSLLLLKAWKIQDSEGHEGQLRSSAIYQDWSPQTEASKKSWGWSPSYYGEPKITEIAALWGICQGHLEAWSGVGLRMKLCAVREAELKGWRYSSHWKLWRLHC